MVSSNKYKGNDVNPISEKDIQRALVLLAAHTSSINFQIEPIFKAKEGDTATTRRLDLLYLSPDGKLATGIEIKNNRITQDDVITILYKKAYPEVLRNEYPDREVILVLTSRIASGISEAAMYVLDHFHYEGVSVKYIPVEQIGESLFAEFVNTRLPASSWIDGRVREEFGGLCLTKLI